MKCEKEKKWDVESLNSFDYDEILNVNLGLLSYVPIAFLHFELYQDVHKAPYTNICISAIFASVSFFLHRKFQKIEQNIYISNISNSFQRILFSSRKKIMGSLIFLNLIPFACSLFYIGKKEFIRACINQNNPYHAKTIEYVQDDSVSFLMDAIEENSSLTGDEKEYLLLLEPYFQENPYLDKEKAYLDLSTLDVCYGECEDDTVLAQYFPQTNEVYMYTDYSLMHLPHEMIHATGDFYYRFLDEGMDALLIAEYLDDGDMITYFDSIYLTEVVIGLVGKDTVLEAFSKSDDRILLDKLAEKMGEEEALEFLEALEEYANASDFDINAFYSMGRILVSCVQKMDLGVEQQAFIYNCFLHSYDIHLDVRYPSKLDEHFKDKFAEVLICLPKFWYNEEKDHSYPEYPVSYEEIVNTFEKMIQDSYFRKHVDGPTTEFSSKLSFNKFFDSFSEDSKGKRLSRK